MSKVKRLRRRELVVDVHSEDEDEVGGEQGVLELSDISGSEASFEDSDIEESESEGEEEDPVDNTQGTGTKTDSHAKESSHESKEKSSSTSEGVTSTNVTKEDIEPPVENNGSLSINDEYTPSKNSPQAILKRVEQVLAVPETHDGSLDSGAEVIPKDNNASFHDDSNSDDLDLPPSHSEDEIDKLDDNQKADEKPLTPWRKKLLARQEYRKRLAEDPAFVPHLGEFWGHDDRFREDGLKNDFARRRPKMDLPFTPRAVWDDSSATQEQRWDHDGFEELMKMEEQEERRRKDFQRRVPPRRGSVPHTNDVRQRSNYPNKVVSPSYPINNNNPRTSSPPRETLNAEKPSSPVTPSISEKTSPPSNESLAAETPLNAGPKDSNVSAPDARTRERNIFNGNHSRPFHRGSLQRNSKYPTNGSQHHHNNHPSSFSFGFNSRGGGRFGFGSRGHVRSSSHSRIDGNERWQAQSNNNIRPNPERTERRYSEFRKRDLNKQTNVEVETSTITNNIDATENKDDSHQQIDKDPKGSNLINGNEVTLPPPEINNSEQPENHIDNIVQSTTSDSKDIEEQSVDDLVSQVSLIKVTETVATETEALTTKEQTTNNILEESEDEESDVEIILEHQGSRKKSTTNGNNMNTSSLSNNMNIDNVIKSEPVRVRISSPTSDKPIDFSNLKSTKFTTPATPPSKRYSSRRVAVNPAVASTTTSTSMSELTVTESNKNDKNNMTTKSESPKVTGEIPASAVYAAPFTPRSAILVTQQQSSNYSSEVIDDEHLEGEKINGYIPAETPYPLGGETTTLAATALPFTPSPQTTGGSPIQYATEENGMVYYYDPNAYNHPPYYYYPVEPANTGETLDGSDPTTNGAASENSTNNVYYTYYPVYYHG